MPDKNHHRTITVAKSFWIKQLEDPNLISEADLANLGQHFQPGGAYTISAKSLILNGYQVRLILNFICSPQFLKT